MTHEMTTDKGKEDKDKENKENEEEEETRMIGNKNPLLPTVLWAQRRDRVFLTVEIKNAIRDSIKLEVRNPYPLEAMEEEEGKGAALGYVGTSVVVFSCESLDVCGEEEEEKEGILMIDDCSVETVGEKLKRQAFGGEDEEEESSKAASPTSVVDGQQRLRSPLSRERRRKKHTHAIELELYNAVLSNQISHKLTVTDKTVHLVLFKPKPTPHWPRLLATREKFRHVKTDFDSWKDEDEELEDENKFTFDANKMLKIDQYEDAELFDDISSDDEDMPDLTEMV
jgi:hypothetical protein